jgi:acyl carrier protein
MNATAVEPVHTRDEAGIQHWLVEHIAASIKVAPTDIDVTLPFSYYGLDSLAAVGMSGDLEQWLGRKLPPTLTWDYPTIERLAAHLAEG